MVLICYACTVHRYNLTLDKVTMVRKYYDIIDDSIVSASIFGRNLLTGMEQLISVFWEFYGIFIPWLRKNRCIWMPDIWENLPVKVLHYYLNGGLVLCEGFLIYSIFWSPTCILGFWWVARLYKILTIDHLRSFHHNYI